MIKQSIFCNLLRIITPEEINVLTKNFDRNDRISLMSIVNDDIDNFKHIDENPGKPKILSLVNDEKLDSLDNQSDIEIKGNKNLGDNKKKSAKDTAAENKVKGESKDNILICGCEVSEILEKFILENLANENNIFADKRKIVDSSNEEYESTEFILGELTKTHKNNDKLKKLNVWKLYSQNSVVDVHINKNKTEGSEQKISQSSTKGILINKRQA